MVNVEPLFTILFNVSIILWLLMGLELQQFVLCSLVMHLSSGHISKKNIKQKNKSMSNVTVNHKIQYWIVFGTGKRLLCPYSSQNTVIIQPTINFSFITTHWKRFCKQGYNLCKYSFSFIQNTNCGWMPMRSCSTPLVSPWIHLQYLIQ